MSGRKSKSVAARLAGHLMRLSAPKAASLSLAALCAAPGVLAAQSTIILQGRVTADIHIAILDDAVLLEVDVRARTALVEALEERAREALGATVYGVDEEAFEDEVGLLLRQRGLTVATLESNPSLAL